MTAQDTSQEILAQITEARACNRRLDICAGNSKRFYGREPAGEKLDISGHTGIISYEPTELVITARAGTPLHEIEAVLDTENQMLGFEPASFGDSASIGGTVACGFSGPRRAFAGSARDFILGSTIINGKAERIHFGGEVMKNVAGYDVSRLMCGAMGTLGVLLDVSLKVLPRPESEITLVFEMCAADALKRVHQLARQSLPISATCFDDERLYVRLSGTEGAIKSAQQQLGGDELPGGDNFWYRLKEHALEFFAQGKNIWRVSLASNSPILNLQGIQLYEWNGALRWLATDDEGEKIRTEVSRYGGHAVCFHQYGKQEQVFHPLDTGQLKIHRNLKSAFDPDAILNPGRMYAEI